jgi:CarD family transcriptional regulator
MYKVGQYVVYCGEGVFKVDSIGTLDLSGVSGDDTYYTLLSPFRAGSKVYALVGNEEGKLRDVITKKEAKEVLDNIALFDDVDVPNEKQKDEIYKKLIHKNDFRDLAKIVKTMYVKKVSKIAAGKKMTSGDDRYYRMAEERLIGELAIVLDLDRGEIKKIIDEKLGEISI